MAIFWWIFLLGAALISCFSLPILLKESEKCKYIILGYLQTVNPNIKDLTSKQLVFLSIITSILFGMLWPVLLVLSLNKPRS